MYIGFKGRFKCVIYNIFFIFGSNRHLTMSPLSKPTCIPYFLFVKANACPL